MFQLWCYTKSKHVVANTRDSLQPQLPPARRTARDYTHVYGVCQPRCATTTALFRLTDSCRTFISAWAEGIRGWHRLRPSLGRSCPVTGRKEEREYGTVVSSDRQQISHNVDRAAADFQMTGSGIGNFATAGTPVSSERQPL